MENRTATEIYTRAWNDVRKPMTGFLASNSINTGMPNDIAMEMRAAARKQNRFIRELPPVHLLPQALHRSEEYHRSHEHSTPDGWQPDS